MLTCKISPSFRKETPHHGTFLITIDFFFSSSSTQDYCQNYIRVLVKAQESKSRQQLRLKPGDDRAHSDKLLVCGTNAFNPRCRYYVSNPNGDVVVEEEFSGKGFCPHDPRHNSTAIFTGILLPPVRKYCVHNYLNYWFTNLGYEFGTSAIS